MTTQRGLPRNEILIGDAVTRLSELPSASVDCVITSPPYFALRDYGHAGQLGLETDVDGWVQSVLRVTSEVRRVLKPTGAFWLNLGDSYAHHLREGAPKKSLLMGPERIALSMTRGGWLLRNKVIWAKTNPMPSNVTDRLSATHEFVYFFTKSPTYFFDLNAIRVPHSSGHTHGHSPKKSRVYPPAGALPTRTDRPPNLNTGLAAMSDSGVVGHPLGKNPGDVWQMGTASFHGDHFAVFPPRLIERPLLATCPERVCTACGLPWLPSQKRLSGRLLAIGPLQAACACGAGWQLGLVLDPFFGAGTTALVAEKHQRDWLGVELNPEYAALASTRLADWRATQEGATP
ncbi:DNA-methyltransferase [Actinomadura macra]|uniref:DNA-methyltransferase n=1 Tax=Actinomadura macra TaxID=46164 RepID=UPI000B2BEE34|nr:site-specific DNA-methyltransferase [Actinomadura macra]